MKGIHVSSFKKLNNSNYYYYWILENSALSTNQELLGTQRLCVSPFVKQLTPTHAKLSCLQTVEFMAHT